MTSPSGFCDEVDHAQAEDRRPDTQRSQRGEAPRRRTLRARDLADLLRVDTEKERELREPLIEQRSTVDEDQRTARSRRDEVCADHCLADARWRDKEASIVGQQCACC
jgi:hypothetical protein